MGPILLGWGQPSSAPDFRSHFPSFCIYGSGAQCCDYGVHIHDFIHLVLKRKRCILDCLCVQYYIWINRTLLGGGWDWICHWAFSTSITFNTARRLQTGLEERKGHLCAGWTTFIQDKMRVLVLEAGNCYLLFIYCKEQTEVLQNLRTGSPAGQQNCSHILQSEHWHKMLVSKSFSRQCFAYFLPCSDLERLTVSEKRKTSWHCSQE